MQDILAISIAGVAVGFLLRRAWQQLAQRRSGGCGACSKCPSAGAASASQLVAISPVQSQAEAQSSQ